MGFAVGVFGRHIGATRDKPLLNGAVFATRQEADRAGNELLVRWSAPEGFVVVPVKGAPTASLEYGSYEEVTIQRGFLVKERVPVPQAVRDAQKRRAEAVKQLLAMFEGKPGLRAAVAARHRKQGAL